MQSVIDIRRKTIQNLYRELAPCARRYLAHMRCPEEDIEDFLQEAFLRLWNKHRNVPEGMEKAYLMRMLKNLWIDEFRRNKAKRNFQQAFEQEMEEQVERDGRSMDCARVLLWNKLSEAARDPRAHAFVLQVKQGLSVEQIAKVTEAPMGTVAAQIARYRQQFKTSFQQSWETSVWC